MTGVLAWLRRDTGALAPFAVILVPVLLVLGGLVVDGTRELNARAQAQAYAEEAARAGATAVDPAVPELTLDDALARRRVDAYCAVISSNADVTGCALVSIGAVGPTDPRRIRVTVQVETRLPTTLLGLVGVAHLDASGRGSARPYEGVTGADAG